jgi:hypothetical protein
MNSVWADFGPRPRNTGLAQRLKWFSPCSACPCARCTRCRGHGGVGGDGSPVAPVRHGRQREHEDGKRKVSANERGHRGSPSSSGQRGEVDELA